MSVWADPPVPGARIEAGKDSGRRHLCLEEMSRGFLRPSLEETLAFSRSRSVGEEEEAGVVGTCWIRFFFFILFFPCYSFVFSFCYHTLIAFFCGDSGAPFHRRFSFVAVSPRVKGRPEVRGLGVSWWSFPGSELSVTWRRVSRRGVKDQVGVRGRSAWYENRFRCFSFWWVSLVRFAESRGCLFFWAGGLFRTFSVAAVVTGSRMYQ